MRCVPTGPKQTKRLYAIGLAIGLCGLLTAFGGDVSRRTQSAGEGWSEPVAIFESRGESIIRDPVVVTDREGTAHVFWTILEEDRQGRLIESIYHASISEGEFSDPIDIIAGPSIHSLDATVDHSGTLHLLWRTEQQRLLYSHARPEDAHSAKGWAAPIALDVGQTDPTILSPEDGLLYVGIPGLNDTGVYLRSSRDGGRTWHLAGQIASAPPDAAPNDVQLASGSDGSLHATWTEYRLPDAWPPVGVYYSQSDDGGQTWNRPIPPANSSATPKWMDSGVTPVPSRDDVVFRTAGRGYDEMSLAVVGEDEIHLAWNGMAGVGGRYHQWSNDGGRSWSDVATLTPAGGTEGPPQLVVDSLGAVHLTTSVNQRVWYARWEEGQWASLEYIPSGDERRIPAVGERIDEHRERWIEEVSMAISKGNRLHVVFWDVRPERSLKYLWYVTRQVEAPVMEAAPHATDISSPVQDEESDQPASAALPTGEPTARPDFNNPSAARPGSPSYLPFVAALTPTLLLLVGGVAWMRWKRTH